jgi:hypothetical protein
MATTIRWTLPWHLVLLQASAAVTRDTVHNICMRRVQQRSALELENILLKISKRMPFSCLHCLA